VFSLWAVTLATFGSAKAAEPLIIGLAKTEADYVVAEPIEYPK
jgi:hypothetical protein